MKKAYHDYSFTNDFVFSTVMKDPLLCRQVLERILDKPIEELRVVEPLYGVRRVDPKDKNKENSQADPQGKSQDESQVESQKTMDFDVFCRGVRLDILFKGETTWYNIEMQCGKYYDIPLRSRYYGSHMDMEQLPKGGKYTQLKTTYVIFICTFDLYGLNEPVYFFE
ncbi:MAG: PD-(D/E)XK nuclease family transposase, partial [Bacillota bacterium]|nr:PD-(D/E)XK nuclease family transposase [Bacillota bacterium]